MEAWFLESPFEVHVVPMVVVVPDAGGSIHLYMTFLFPHSLPILLAVWILDASSSS
jgi:hypothetical protein